MGWRGVWSAALGACALACGGASHGNASGSTAIQGSVAGAAVSTASTIALVGPLIYTFGPFTSNGVTVLISNIAGACSVVQNRDNPPNASALEIIVATPGPVGAGTYAISTTTLSAASTIGALVYETAGASCATTTSHPARAGSITLSAISSASVEGSFSVTLDTGDALSGTFVAPVCDEPYDAGALKACGM